MIVVTVNGKERELDAPTNLVSYLEQLGVAEQRLAVAYNEPSGAGRDVGHWVASLGPHCSSSEPKVGPQSGWLIIIHPPTMPFVAIP